MNIYGISNLSRDNLNFEYDKYYKEISLKLKEAKEPNNIRKEFREKFSKQLNINIDTKILKENFINILKDDNSAKYLWILYSKYEDEENYIDKISKILKDVNKVFRGGINLYKLNGWMTHSLYVYQIANYNVAKNLPIANFDGDSQKYEYINQLYELHKNLSITGKFMLKVLSLVHDIGVIENVTYHDKVGPKYVDDVLKQIGITDENLEEFNISFNNLKIFIEQAIKYHTIMALLSGENSDECFENYIKQMLSDLPEIEVKGELAKIMYIFTFADVIAVNEIILDEEKFRRLKNAYIFWEETMHNQVHNRDKEKVTLERICDMCGKKELEVTNNIDEILNKLEIDKSQFMKDMYDVKWFHYTGPLMKTMNNLEMSIKVFNAVINLVKCLDSENALKDYIITFEPTRPSIEYEFIEMFNNNDFFEAVKLAQKEKNNVTIYKKVKIEKNEVNLGKHLNLSILE